MLQIKDLQVNLEKEKKQILYGVNLEVKPGETHVIQGRNGSGKSTLAAVLSGSPHFEVTGGRTNLVNEEYPDYIWEKAKLEKSPEINLLQLDPAQRSLLGVFLANQYPLEIPGVNLSNFLRLAYNARQPQDLPVFKFRKLLKERAEIIQYPEKLLDRNLNEGFSGGEKKKTEILQLALLEPRYAILDETDSGLDKHALVEVFTGIKKLRAELLPNLAVIIISHYDKVFDYLPPDHIHEMEHGKLVATR